MIKNLIKKIINLIKIIRKSFIYQTDSLDKLTDEIISNNENNIKNLKSKINKYFNRRFNVILKKYKNIGILLSNSELKLNDEYDITIPKSEYPILLSIFFNLSKYKDNSKIANCDASISFSLKKDDTSEEFIYIENSDVSFFDRINKTENVSVKNIHLYEDQWHSSFWSGLLQIATVIVISAAFAAAVVVGLGAVGVNAFLFAVVGFVESAIVTALITENFFLPINGDMTKEGLDDTDVKKTQLGIKTEKIDNGFNHRGGNDHYNRHYSPKSGGKDLYFIPYRKILIPQRDEEITLKMILKNLKFNTNNEDDISEIIESITIKMETCSKKITEL